MRKRRPVLVGCFVFLVAVLLPLGSWPGWSSRGENECARRWGTAVTLTPEQLAGTWRAAEGGAVTFASDGTFSLSQVPGHYLSDDRRRPHFRTSCTRSHRTRSSLPREYPKATLVTRR